MLLMNISLLMSYQGKDEFELEWNDEVDEYNPADFGIQLVSHPMNYTDSQFDKELL